MLKAIAIKLVTLFAAGLCLVLVPPPLGLWLALAVVLAALGLIAWAVFDVNSSFWADTLWHNPAMEKCVALTFDDGPDETFTPQVLAILREKSVPGAFFLVGQRVEKSPALAREIAAQGHLLGNHSFSHAMFINFGLQAGLTREIQACNAAIEKAAGVQPRLYRPPHGFKNPSLGDALRRLDMQVIGWQVRGFDAVARDPGRIATRVVDGAQSGGVITLHDGAGLQGSHDRSGTLDALPVIIDGLRARGFKFVRLDELLKIAPYTKTQPSPAPPAS